MCPLVLGDSYTVLNSVYQAALKSAVTLNGYNIQNILHVLVGRQWNTLSPFLH
jgi:hypothetical protein